MRKIYKNALFLLVLVLGITTTVSAQYTTKKVRSKHQAYTDSLKSMEYNYVFPILGQGAYSEGFDIPYPMGIMANYFYTEMDILINNFQLGYQNAYKPENSFDMRPLIDENGEEILRFGENNNKSYSLNVRPDIWIFPFLDLYGIFGYGHSDTRVVIEGLGSYKLPQPLVSQVAQDIRTAGVGVLVAGGIGPVWLSGDFNFTWNKPALLDKPTRVNVMGIRMGHTFVFPNRPHSNIAIWVGGMRVKMQSETIGAIPLQDAFGQEFWDKKDETVNEYWDWYNNEATEIQKKIADRTLSPIVDAIDKRQGESIVQYGMDKQASQLWTMLLGAQYQLNKHWQLRFETGFLGTRKSYLVSLNYRFLGFKKPSKSH